MNSQESTIVRDRIRSALEESRNRGEEAIQVAAYLDGQLIINEAIGEARPGQAATTSTLFPVFSVSKALTATALHRQAELGLVDYESPVAKYWPEFAAHGKEAITVRHVLSHRSGIPWMPEGVTPELQANWSWMITQIEQTQPSYGAGSTNCYHALIWGWIVAEIVRRTDTMGRPFEQFLREEVLDPIGVTDAYLGLPESQDLRVATLLGGSVPLAGPEDLYLHGMPPAVFPGSVVYNTALSRRTINPGAGIIADAKSIARFFAVLAGRGELDGVRLLSEDRVLSFTEPRPDTEQPDAYMGVPAHVGTSGYWVGGPAPAGYALLGDNPQLLHHPGAGGSIGWAELDTGLAVAINHNFMRDAAGEDPFTPVVTAVRETAAELLGRVGAV
ncbi:serine hydrolase domain-containing protein [Pseudarthrobacter sp. NPDC058329]|uniref:serine hydrolase domain-containing protein n=1 Tax=Pseudarthrobacter sp. NPDC058329 TaxID=3346448 RepID=UPI0036D96623